MSFPAISEHFAYLLLPRLLEKMFGEANVKANAMPKLTKRVVENLTSAIAEKFVWDSEVKGLGIRIKPSGSKSYFIQYRNHTRRTRRMVLGSCSVLALDEARSLAREKLVDVIKGLDPSAERKALLNSETVEQLCFWYLREAEAGRLLGRKRRPIKSSTLKADRNCITSHVVPLIGRLLVSGVVKADIEKLMADITRGKTAKPRNGRGGVTTGGRGVAVRVVTVLHSIFEHAIRMDLVDSNPVRGIRKPAYQVKDRRLSEAEIIQLGRTMANMAKEGESPTGILAIKFLLLTGFRRNEALALRTSWIGRSGGFIQFPDTKSGRQVRIIGQAATSLIHSKFSRKDDCYVFPADFGGGHFIGLPRVLGRITLRAGISGITLHTLRHTFASMAAEMGFTELTIAGLLGHASRGVTQRYIHIDEALVLAADKVSTRMRQLLDQRQDRET